MEATLDVGYGDYLSDLARWDWWLTGTFEYEATLGTARRAANSFTRHFEPFTGAYAIESRNRWQSKDRGSNVHLHALVELEKGETRLRPSDGVQWWEARFGFAVVKRFEPGDGASQYVAKYATKNLHQDHTSWDIYRGGESAADDVPF